MSHGYVPVQWTPFKKRYDLVLAGGVVGFLGLFAGLTLARSPDATAEIVLMRATALCAVTLLHVILVIGPLARLDPRFLPLLYNRRHLGVTMFLVAAVHAALAVVTYHALGDVNPLLSVLISNPRTDSISQFPFQPLGVGALGILFLMAATSHDFWLRTLTAPIWKALHMGVYVAYALVVGHVSLGVLQSETHPLFAGIVGAGVVAVVGLHSAAAWVTREPDTPSTTAQDDDLAGFVDCGPVDDIPESRARVVTLADERVALFKHDGQIHAVSNVCKHQNGPLGEGRIVDGCITCPWHGFQYDPKTGASPPPFDESIPTFRAVVRDGRVWVHPTPQEAVHVAHG